MKTYIIAFFLALTLFFTPFSANAEPVSTESIRYVLGRFPIAAADVKDSYKPTQLDTIAIAIQEATQTAKWNDNDRVTLAALLISVGWHESRFALRIHTGVPKYFSYGLFQVHPFSHGVKRADLVGLTRAETVSSATIAARILSRSWQCGGTPAGWFTAYYGGVSCGTDWPTLKARVNTYYWVRQELVNRNK